MPNHEQVNMHNLKILITGASGFIGSALSSRLKLDGVPFRAALRKSSADTASLFEDSYEIGEIGPSTDWSSAVKGVGVVIHLAARAHIMLDTALDPLTGFRTVNVLGTERLARQAAQ